MPGGGWCRFRKRLVGFWRRLLYILSNVRVELVVLVCVVCRSFAWFSSVSFLGFRVFLAAGSAVLL